MFYWPGAPEDEIMVVVHQSGGRQELFHRHDYFYFNYTYEGEYDSISFKYDNRITIREGELYAGQPFAGHALCVHDDKETTIMGVLIQKRHVLSGIFANDFCKYKAVSIFCLTRPPINFLMNISITKSRTTATYGRFWR